MKKLLILCTFAAFFAACNTEEGDTPPPTPQEGEYIGTLIVTDNTQTPPTEARSANIHYILTRSTDGLLSLTMSNIRFVASMPMALTIVIPKLRLENKMLISTQDPIIAEMGGKPQPAFGISQFSGRVDNDQLDVTFTCIADNPLGPARPLQLNHKAVYKGKILK